MVSDEGAVSAPRLTATRPGHRHGSAVQRCRNDARRSATASSPSLLKPYRLITALRDW